ncbi:MAG: hypothetical protein KF832_28485 [Caldilineaceae bacterium]|nr:hypothetical protein [Caldilineaceae bacterium]
MDLRKWAWLYAAMFLGIAALSYIPGLKDNQGLLFGLFSLQLYDDLLHAGSAVWAALAAMRSTWAARFYFQLFGLVYFFDGIVGLLFGEAYLDLGILRYGPQPYTWAHKIGANFPHILIGGVAIYIGFVLSRRYRETRYA